LFYIEQTHVCREREASKMPDATPIAHSEHVLRLSSNDADELTTQIPDWDVELTQLQPGVFRGELTFISLGPALICVASSINHCWNTSPARADAWS
jgi:hypothetical protein